MNTHRDPRELAVDLLDRSSCKIQVAAVLWDASGIFSWGWNHERNGNEGEHAEEHAIKRANPKRLRGGRLTVAARRKKNGQFILARPCAKERRDAPWARPCLEICHSVGLRLAEFTNKGGGWEVINL